MDTGDPYPGRVSHWIKLNEQERRPSRWIVADSEAFRDRTDTGESQSFRCAVAVRWRTDLKTGTHDEWLEATDRDEFWPWVAEHCTKGRRTVLWFHNASYDLRTLAAFTELPLLGFELEWCNLDRDVSVATFRSERGTLVIADTWTWLSKALEAVAGMVGIGKPKLPRDADSMAAWLTRCRQDVLITRQAVNELLSFIDTEHLGNWQPSGAGMGYAAWRHRFMKHKVLVHNDAPAIAAEREAMHAGRAEAWWHGKVPGGPFAEWDMHMAYCRIAAECDIPIRLYAYDRKPSRKVHQWALEHWGILARVEVTVQTPVVPCHHDGRVIWPVGTFITTLWHPELELIKAAGGTYKVLEQWRYDMAPALREWAQWSMRLCGVKDGTVTPVQQTWVKHQSRALIGRLALRTATWEHWGDNPGGRTGLSTLLDIDDDTQSRMMHVGARTFVERDRQESQSSLPQITGYIMCQSRVRLWHAAKAAGLANVAHVDTDSVIVNAAGSAALEAADPEQIRGGWRRKESWAQLHVTGPRHYRSSVRRVIPGVPAGAAETAPDVFVGQVWESLATALDSGITDTVRLFDRTWRPKRFDGRRPWGHDGPADPIRLPIAGTSEGIQHVVLDTGQTHGRGLVGVPGMPSNGNDTDRPRTVRHSPHPADRTPDDRLPPKPAGDRLSGPGDRTHGDRPRRIGAHLRG